MIKGKRDGRIKYSIYLIYLYDFYVCTNEFAVYNKIDESFRRTKLILDSFFKT